MAKIGEDRGDDAISDVKIKLVDPFSWQLYIIHCLALILVHLYNHMNLMSSLGFPQQLSDSCTEIASAGEPAHLTAQQA